ncbi:MAG TPA: LysE family transporter [Kofleriaceae bacterium]|nr:LysE family transporter [Kofleriaceae bacterium]
MLDTNRYRAAAARDPFRRPLVVVPSRTAIAINAVVAVGVIALGLAQRLTPDVFGFFAIGLGIGVATCIPIGIANVIVIDAAYRHGARRALGASLGGALADGLYASLGIFGIGPLIGRYPTVPYVLHAISGCVLLVYGVVLLRARPALAGPVESRSSGNDSHLLGGFLVGLGATLLNPSAIVTWVVIVGGHATGITRVEASAWVVGIVVGTLAWFLVVMGLALRGRRVLREKAVWMTRIVAVVVIGSGLLSFARVVDFVFGAR